MAMIEPFPGLRYDLGRVGSLSDVIAPPYDVIDAALQQKLYDQHPYNIIRLELNKPEAGDSDNDRYVRAGTLWKQWQLDRVLRSEAQPALYVLHQTYEVDGQSYTRQGVFVRLRLERFGEGKVYPHEQTLSGPKEDRFRLMQAVHANLSPVFGLYPDPACAVQTLLNNHILRTLPVEAHDHLGVVSKVWNVQDTSVIREVRTLLSDKPVFIADGHHRYETAIRYRDELIKKDGELPHDHPANFVLMALVGMSDPGLLILPTHRLVQGFAGLTASQLKTKLEPHYEVEVIGQGEKAGRETWERIEMDGSQDVLGFGTLADDTWMLAHFNAQALMDSLAPSQSPAWRSLAVSRLHVVVLDKLLADTGKATCKYVHLMKEVFDDQKLGQSNLACLVPPATMQHVTDIAGSLEKMPPKSTYFYPKLLTGLVFHSLK
ncbi:MAG TPA: DUF1015 domain-containing protein [Gemmatales bacterium]|nr:DUF1015 domain-containing protein [Gemmatales bacterium]